MEKTLTNTTIRKYDKIPDWAKEAITEEVLFFTQIIQKLDKEKLEQLKLQLKKLTPIQHNICVYLSKCGTKIRKDIVKELNTSRTTIYDNLEKIERKRIVQRFPISNGKRGRPPVYWRINRMLDLTLFQALILKPIKKPIKKPINPNILNNPTKKSNTPNNQPTRSYILTNRKSELTIFILDEINKSTFIKVPTLSRRYVSMLFKADNSIEKEKIKRSASIRIGRITTELAELGIIISHSESVYKNLYKNKLYKILDEKMEQHYSLIKFK